MAEGRKWYLFIQSELGLDSPPDSSYLGNYFKSVPDLEIR